MGALQLPEQNSIKLGNCLILVLMRHVEHIAEVREVILARGRDLLELLLRGIAGGISRSRLQIVSDIISQMLITCITEFSQWMEVSEGVGLCV